MKILLSISALCLLAGLSACKPGSGGTDTAAPTAAAITITEPQVVEAGCGQCLLSMKGKSGCDLAVRIENKTYFVDGFKMDQFGDPHADGGLCQVIRQAKVTGTTTGDRFAAATFEVLPATQAQPQP